MAVTSSEGHNFVVELASFSDVYESAVTGVIRARDARIEGNTLILESAWFREVAMAVHDFAAVRDAAQGAWSTGISYRREVTDDDGRVTQRGLRVPQRGALHAIASHWTLGAEPALVVMPTGTGKTEVMMAAAVSAEALRVLVIVPTDALRQQTGDKFLTYGLLQSLGVVADIPKPVMGLLSSKPEEDHFDALRACNVVVTTMASIGLAGSAVQERFAQIFSHVFFDEAHHMEAATWKRFRQYCSHASTLLFTATPFREDGRAIEGRIIYSFPLSAAQEQGYFKPIRFLEVFEPDTRRADEAIAQVAVGRLREDLAAGHNHLMMARASTIDAAEKIYREIYTRHYSDLNPVLIHSRSPGKRALLNAIRSSAHKIVVCVDMFGEGFDLPNLKVAALHSVHKSLGITLQFIGRFARSGENVSQATFVANTAEDGVPESLENLYREDADWNLMLADMSYDAINPQERLSDLVAGLQTVAEDERAPDISTVALKPTISARVYRTTEFHPDRYAAAFSARHHIHQPQISRRDNFLILVVNQKERLDWTDSRDIAMDSWDLYIAYFDPNRNLLYIHCSRKGNATDGLAKAVAVDPVLIGGEKIFKTFSRLRRLILHSVGLSSRSKNVRYQMFAGLDVRNAIDPVLQQDKMKSNVTGVGYEDGKRYTVGCSRKGKIWSMTSGSIARWKTWCDHIGSKLSDPNAQPNDFLRYTLVPSLVHSLPTDPALMVDWPDQLFESANFRFEVTAGDRFYDFHDCQIDLAEWGDPQSFKFTLRAGDDIAVTMVLRVVPPAVEGSQEGTYTVRHESGPRVTIQAVGQSWPEESFFETNPPLVRLADGSQLSGNILLKPREELGDTFDRSQIRPLDWAGVDIQKESRWRDGALRPELYSAEVHLTSRKRSRHIHH